MDILKTLFPLFFFFFVFPGFLTGLEVFFIFLRFWSPYTTLGYPHTGTALFRRSGSFPRFPVSGNRQSGLSSEGPLPMVSVVCQNFLPLICDGLSQILLQVSRAWHPRVF